MKLSCSSELQRVPIKEGSTQNALAKRSSQVLLPTRPSQTELNADETGLLWFEYLIDLEFAKKNASQVPDCASTPFVNERITLRESTSQAVTVPPKSFVNGRKPITHPESNFKAVPKKPPQKTDSKPVVEKEIDPPASAHSNNSAVSDQPARANTASPCDHASTPSSRAPGSQSRSCKPTLVTKSTQHASAKQRSCKSESRRCADPHRDDASKQNKMSSPHQELTPLPPQPSAVSTTDPNLTVPESQHEFQCKPQPEVCAPTHLALPDVVLDRILLASVVDQHALAAAIADHGDDRRTAGVYEGAQLHTQHCHPHAHDHVLQPQPQIVSDHDAPAGIHGSGPAAEQSFGAPRLSIVTKAVRVCSHAEPPPRSRETQSVTTQYPAVPTRKYTECAPLSPNTKYAHKYNEPSSPSSPLDNEHNTYTITNAQYADGESYMYGEIHSDSTYSQNPHTCWTIRHALPETLSPQPRAVPQQHQVLAGASPEDHRPSAAQQLHQPASLPAILTDESDTEEVGQRTAGVHTDLDENQQHDPEPRVPRLHEHDAEAGDLIALGLQVRNDLPDVDADAEPEAEALLGLITRAVHYDPLRLTVVTAIECASPPAEPPPPNNVGRNIAMLYFAISTAVYMLPVESNAPQSSNLSSPATATEHTRPPAEPPPELLSMRAEFTQAHSDSQPATTHRGAADHRGGITGVAKRWYVARHPLILTSSAFSTTTPYASYYTTNTLRVYSTLLHVLHVLHDLLVPTTSSMRTSLLACYNSTTLVPVNAIVSLQGCVRRNALREGYSSGTMSFPGSHRRTTSS